MHVEILNNNKDLMRETLEKDKNIRRVVGYARVSTEKDEQFSSYESQIEYYTNYIKTNEGWEFIDIYTDEGISGTSTKKRIGFQKMIKDALKGKFDLIITKSISRFARNTLDSLTAIRKLKENNVEIYFEKENIWTFDSKGELLITIMSSIAQEESRSISMNVTWGIRQRMKQGQAYVPYKVFLGYDKGPDGNMIINEEQARIVRKIFGYAMQNRTSYAIAKIMEKEHIPFSPGVYKWYASTVRSILRNEKYKGDAIRQKTYTIDYLSKRHAKNIGDVPQYYIHNHHPAIIPPDLFDRLQESLNNHPYDNDKRSRNYTLSKKIICGDCESYYGRVVWRKGTKQETVVWRCNNKFKEGHCRCKSPTLKESFIKQLFVKKINLLINNSLIIIRTLKTIIKESIVKTKMSLINKYLKMIKKSIATRFDEDMWHMLLEKVVVHSKGDIVMVFRNGHKTGIAKTSL